MDTIKAIALDLDGTLLNSNKEISEETFLSLKRCYSKGIAIIIVTGRTFEATKKIVELFDFPIHTICYNGAKILNSLNGETLYELPLDENIVKTLIEVSHKYNIHLNLYQNDIWFVENSSRNESVYYSNHTSLTPKEINFDKFEDYRMTKGLFIADNEKLHQIEKILTDELHLNIHTTYSQHNYLEILNVDVNKGKTLMQYLKTLNIKPEECIAFGDAENDIEMLKSVKYGVAMGNATGAVKRCVKYITNSNNDHGIANFLNNFFI